MEFRIGDTFTDSLGEEHPGEPGDRRPGRRGWANPHTLLAGRVVWRRCMRSTLLITRSTWPTSRRWWLAFTAIAGVGTSRCSTGRGCRGLRGSQLVYGRSARAW